MSYKRPDLQNLKYFDDSCLSSVMYSLYISILMPLGFPPPRPVKLALDACISYEEFIEMAQGIISLPQSYTVKKVYNRIKYNWLLALTPVSLRFLGRSIGYDHNHHQLHLRSHQLRFYLLRISTDISLLFIYLPVLTIIPIGLFFSLSREWVLIESQQLNVIWILVYASSLIVIYMVPALLVFRILFAVSQRLLAESLCVQEVIHIIFDLSREDVLTHPDKKYLLLNRIRYLSRLSSLISTKYYGKKSKMSQKWVENHFKAISLYIEERGRWIFAPSENTLTILREDFFNLANLYITGNYGEFNWNTINTYELSTPFQKRQKILGTGMAKLFGIGIPLVILGAHISLSAGNRESIFPGIPSANVTYIILAWFLITVDIALKLGVVKSLIELAKSLKDLSN